MRHHSKSWHLKICLIECITEIMQNPQLLWEIRHIFAACHKYSNSNQRKQTVVYIAKRWVLEFDKLNHFHQILLKESNFPWHSLKYRNSELSHLLTPTKCPGKAVEMLLTNQLRVYKQDWKMNGNYHSFSWIEFFANHNLLSWRKKNS